jgi:hypothetical protein
VSALTLFNSWVRGNCQPAAARKDLVGQAGQAQRQGRDCHFLIGDGLTRTRRAYLVHLLGEELFVFMLSAEQAASNGARGARLRVTFDPPRPAPRGRPPHRLEGLQLENAIALELARPICGRCTIHSGDAHFEAPVCLRLDMALSPQGAPDRSNWSCRFFYPSPPVLPSGQMAFEFPPVNDPQDAQEQYGHRQVTAAFLRVFPDPNYGLPAVPLSNAAAQLVTFA